MHDQPPPIENELPPMWGAVIDDMRERDAVGRERYGTPLQPFNGRAAVVDAYQEALDLVVYLRQAHYELQVLVAEVAPFLLTAKSRPDSRRPEFTLYDLQVIAGLRPTGRTATVVPDPGVPGGIKE